MQGFKENETKDVAKEVRKRRCYELVSRLTDIENEIEEQAEQLRTIKRRKVSIEGDLESEKRAFLEQAASSATSSSLGTSSVSSDASGAEDVPPSSLNAERVWEEWILDAKTSHLSQIALRRGKGGTPGAGSTTAPSSSSTEASVPTGELPVPVIHERPAAAEPPRLQSRVRTRRSLSLTGPRPSTPVRKRLEWEGVTGEPGGSLTPARSASASPATPAGVCRQPPPTLATPVRACLASKTERVPVDSAATPDTTRVSLIKELLGPSSPTSQKASSPVPSPAASNPAEPESSARVLFEE